MAEVSLENMPRFDTNLIVGLFFFLYMAIWLCGVINRTVLKRHFFRHYPDLARAVFDPVAKNSLTATLDRARYFFAREYAEIDDPTFVERIDRHRQVEIYAICGVVLGMLVGLVFILVLRPNA